MLLLVIGCATVSVVKTKEEANLLLNPSFEEGTRGWHTESHAWYEQPKGSGLSLCSADTKDACTGKASLQIVGKGNRGVAIQNVKALPECEYEVVCWLKCADLDDTTAACSVEFIGPRKHLGGTLIGEVKATTDWVRFSKVIKTPPETATLRVLLLTRKANLGTAWFDDVSLVRLVPPAKVTCLKIGRAEDGNVTLDWAKYKDFGNAKRFRVYRSEKPFDSVKDMAPIAELEMGTKSYFVKAFPEEWFAVTALDADGREDKEVRSVSLLSELSSDATPPDCLWTDNFQSTKKTFCLDRISVADGAAKLTYEKRESAVPISNSKRVKQLNGWKGARCSKAGGRLVFEFTGSGLFAISQRDKSSGIVEVKIDGKHFGEVDLYNRLYVTLASGLKNGPHTAEVIVTGRKREKSTGTSAAIHLLGCRWEGYPSTGTITSTPIICSPKKSFQWGKIRYGTIEPDGTSVKIDILDGQDRVLIRDVPDGAELSSIKSNVIKLRATLTTKNCEVSPCLRFWHVSYRTEQELKGKVCGLVVGADGKGISGASVVAVRDGATKARTVTTDSGFYSFDNLWGGSYDLRIEKTGFVTGELKQVEVPSASLHNCILYQLADVDGKKFTLWTANAMRNLFKDDTPAKGKVTKEIRIEAAKNEYEPAQMAITAHEPLSDVSVQVSDLRHRDGRHTIRKTNIETNFVGYVPVWKNSPSVPENELASKAPRHFPDPLLLIETIDMAKDATQPVWITVNIPKDAAPGDYTGDVALRTAYGLSEMKLRLRVYPFALTDETHVWNGHVGSGWEGINRHYGNAADPEEFWKTVEMCLEALRRHRENLIHVDASLVKCTRVTCTSDGKWRYDFSRLDRWIETILSYYRNQQVRIQFSCFANRDGWLGTEIFFHGCKVYNEDGSVSSEKSLGRVPVDSEEFKRFAHSFFPALQKHLEEKGWLDIVTTRMQDEPLDVSRDAYKRFAATVHEAAPKLKRSEYIQTTGLAKSLELQIPQLDWFEREKDYFLASHKRGREVWFYTCWMPRGLYPCRLIDYPLIKHRIIHWMTYRYQIGGFGRYGWACWHQNPYEDTGHLAPGDSYCVYPDPQKKRLVNSLRWEMMRESVEDYEYLWTLSDAARKVAKRLGAKEGEFDPIAPAMELCAKAVRSCTDYERNPERLMALRRDVAEAIIRMNSRPLLLLKTEPTTSAPIVLSAIKVWGLTERGASVKVNGKDIPVGKDGRFLTEVTVSEAAAEINVIVRRGKDEKTVVKRFTVVDKNVRKMKEALREAESCGVKTVEHEKALDAYESLLRSGRVKQAEIETARKKLIESIRAVRIAELDRLLRRLGRPERIIGESYKSTIAEIQRLKDSHKLAEAKIKDYKGYDLK